MAKRSCFITRLIVFTAFAALLLFQFTFVAEASGKKAPTEVNDFLQPMKFFVVRSSSPVCEPTCPQWIWARGEIVSGTPAQFQRLLKRIGRQRLPVVISSPGGNVDAALKLARMIRKRGLDTAVGNALLIGCLPDRKDCLKIQKEGGVYLGVIMPGVCNSACPLVLAGGINRLASENSFVGLHQVTTVYTRQNVIYRERYKVVNGKKRVTDRKIVQRKKLKSYKTTKLASQTKTELLDFLKEMGVAQSYLAIAQGTPASDIRRLGWPEMLELKLITGSEAPTSLARAGLCLELAGKENCVNLPGAGPTGEDIRTTSRTDGPMGFVVVRSGESGCEPNCPEWISAEGVIDSKAPERFEKFLKEIDGRELPMVISSSSGNLEAALALGRLVRRAGLTTIVGSTVIGGCVPRAKTCLPIRSRYTGNAVSSGGRCVFGCILVLAGGTQRLAGYHTALGWTPPSGLSNNARLEVLAYLDEMGVLPGTLVESAADDLDSYSQWRFYWLRLLTSVNLTVNSVVDGGICGRIPEPANCRSLASATPKL